MRLNKLKSQENTIRPGGRIAVIHGSYFNMTDIQLSLASDLGDEKRLRRSATMQALEWHDFICWLRDERGFPIEKLLADWRANEYDEMEIESNDHFK